jgi:transcriptional regulator with XRE-family HTH domain
MTPEQTGSGTGTIAGKAKQAPTATVDGLVQRVGEVRDEVRIVSEDAEGLHGTLQSQALDARTAELAQREPASLLSDLAADRGLSWTLIAKLLGVSQTSVRKWRRGETVSPENRRQVAKLLAFLEALQARCPTICDQASWLEMRIADESTLTPADLYAMRREQLLFDLAGLHHTPHEVLTAVDPAWRAKYGVDDRYEIATAPDGQPSIVIRDTP